MFKKIDKITRSINRLFSSISHLDKILTRTFDIDKSEKIIKEMQSEKFHNLNIEYVKEIEELLIRIDKITLTRTDLIKDSRRIEFENVYLKHFLKEFEYNDNKRNEEKEILEFQSQAPSKKTLLENEHILEHQIENLALSTDFAVKKNQVAHRNLLFIALILLFYIISSMFFDLAISWIVIGILLFLASIPFADTELVKYRTTCGLYGNSEFEARELLRFLNENSRNGDGNTYKTVIDDKAFIKECKQKFLENAVEA